MRTPEAVSAMLCPVCKVGLAMTDRQGVEIDYCPQCRGVWLDRGELDKIIERSGAADPAPVQAAPPPLQQTPWGGARDHYSDDRFHGGHKDQRYPKKRKSWLEEMFD
ncbi:zf-TFIIB domain-containing protein [Sphingobium boeckii]|uniref:Transcription factor zinc-finger domain-containing protein n=1 Tax=Sphingobium boeckii TaxID=1082345 RepID=A0A7W9EFG5_9SPHN|nr:zf-TFIIB domain-containing protein [Sphingobium boeckii]MBB5686015.1 hypothetical protein [Sphingobium boeckii]